jgi:hypothetical protein
MRMSRDNALGISFGGLQVFVAAGNVGYLCVFKHKF